MTAQSLLFLSTPEGGDRSQTDRQVSPLDSAAWRILVVPQAQDPHQDPPSGTQESGSSADARSPWGSESQSVPGPRTPLPFPLQTSLGGLRAPVKLETERGTRHSGLGMWDIYLSLQGACPPGGRGRGEPTHGQRGWGTVGDRAPAPHPGPQPFPGQARSVAVLGGRALGGQVTAPPGLRDISHCAPSPGSHWARAPSPGGRPGMSGVPRGAQGDWTMRLCGSKT